MAYLRLYCSGCNQYLVPAWKTFTIEKTRTNNLMASPSPVSAAFDWSGRFLSSENDWSEEGAREMIKQLGEWKKSSFKATGISPIADIQKKTCWRGLKWYIELLSSNVWPHEKHFSFSGMVPGSRNMELWSWRPGGVWTDEPKETGWNNDLLS